MDEHNSHQLWGLSPALDLISVSDAAGTEAVPTGDLRILQVAPYDCRHTLQTLSRAHRHCHVGPIHIYIYEEEPENLARHILLLSVLLDGNLPARERMEMFLELHGNVLLREKTSKYLDQQGRVLEHLIVALAGGGRPLEGLGSLLDLSLLKFQDKDALVETYKKYREQVVYDMVKAWDARGRKWYGDRFDFRRNMIDWDYHMRLTAAGTPGQDPALGSIIHFHHFRHWRMHGIAYELRDSTYAQPNRSMLSTAYGRTKEFKDRNGKDVGRAVAAWGFWGDQLNSPYHCFGTMCEEPRFFNVSNKQFTHTSMDIAEHAVLAMLHELRTGQQFKVLEADELKHAKVARGPTTAADLQEEAAKEHTQQQKLSMASSPSNGSTSEQCSTGTTVAVDKLEPDADHSSCSTSMQAAADANASIQAGGRYLPCIQANGFGNDEAAFLPAAEFQGHRSGYAFRTGELGLGYYKDVGPVRLSTTSSTTPARQQQAAVASVSASNQSDIKQQMAQEAEEQLRAQEAELDAAAWQNLSRVRLFLVTGDLVKSLTGRSKHHGSFDVLSVGNRHIHMLGPDYQLDKVAKGNAVLVAETAKYVLQLKKEQVELFDAKIADVAGSAGWRQHSSAQLVSDAHHVFTK